MAAHRKTAGFDAVFADSAVSLLAKSYECSICTFTLRDPVQTKECGHRFCKVCFDDMCKSGGGTVCPLDRTKIDVYKVFEDKAVKRDILDLKVKCNNFNKSCDWKGELRQLEDHISVCPFEKITCPNKTCNRVLQRKELQSHHKFSCHLVCKFCKGKFVYNERKNHKDTCKRLPIKCINDCGVNNIPREEMSNHVNNICEQSVIPCPYRGIGCDAQNLRRRSIDNHMNTSVQKHLELAIKKIATIEKKQKNERNISNHFKDKIDSALGKLRRHGKGFAIFILLGVLLLSWFVQIDRSAQQKIQAHTDEIEIIQKRLNIVDRDFKERNSFIMVIRQYHSKINIAKKDNKPIYSDPVYISNVRMRLEVHMNGNGEAKSTHMSVFINIMKGDWDPIIKWPFNKTITFCILNQENDGNANICSVLHATNFLTHAREYFERPVNDVNVGFGYREFAAHEKIEKGNFVKDDTIFLKCIVGES